MRRVSRLQKRILSFPFLGTCAGIHMAGIVVFLLKIMHEGNGNPMGRWIKRTYAMEQEELTNMLVYLQKTLG